MGYELYTPPPLEEPWPIRVLGLVFEVLGALALILGLPAGLILLAVEMGLGLGLGR